MYGVRGLGGGAVARETGGTVQTTQRATFDTATDPGLEPLPELAVSTPAAPPRIPPGEYSVRFIGARKATLFKRPKLIMEFEVTQHQHAGARLPMYCALPAPGRPLGLSSKLYEAWVLARGVAPSRRDRLALEVFRGRLFRAVVRDVVQGSTTERRSKAPALVYSVVDCLLEREA